VTVKQAVPKRVRETAAKHRKDKENDPWHGARGKREVDYVFLNELWAIIRHNWEPTRRRRHRQYRGGIPQVDETTQRGQGQAAMSLVTRCPE
jgi:hypothetical protein